MPNSRSPQATAGSVILALAAVALPLSRGGVDLWAEAAAAASALAALALVTWRSGSIPRTALALLAVIAVGVAQLVPLPAVLHRISPGALRIFEISLAPLGLYPTTRPLSLDPAASARELAKAIACLAAFAAAHALADTRRRKERVVLGVALSGTAVAVVVIGAALAGVRPLVAARLPFVNPNHLAASLNLSAFVALALALRSHGRARALWVLAFAASGSVSILSLSRGGFLAFFVGAALFAVLHVRSRPESSHAVAPGRLALVAGALVAVLGIASYLAVGPVLSELRTLRSGADDTRLQLLRPALQVVRDFPVLGVGRGAFAPVFTGYELEFSAFTFTHVENEWLQSVLDLGIPGGLLLVGTFAWLWISAARRRDLSSAEVGLLAGTGAVAAHNAVDFSLGILGVAIPFAIAMGLLTRAQRAVSIRPVTFRGAIAGAALVAAAGVGVGFVHDADRDAARVGAAVGGAATARAARAAAVWHPADWVPYATAGVRLSAEGRCAAAMPWLTTAMMLDPSTGVPHVGAARCLAGRDDDAARREYRLAISFGSPALAEAAVRYPALDDLFEIAPATPDGLLSLGAVLAPERPRDAIVAYGRGLGEFADARALLPLARLHARVGAHEDAVRFAQRHAERFPTDAAGYEVAAASLDRLSRGDEAHGVLVSGLAVIPGSPLLLRTLAERAMVARRWSEARRLAEEIAPRTAPEIAEKHLLVARTLAGQGRLAEAIERARSAAAALPKASGPLVSLAAWCEQSGRYDDALEALQRAAALPGSAPGAYGARIAAIEAARIAQRERRALQGASSDSAP